jgi:hypothetical protein
MPAKDAIRTVLNVVEEFHQQAPSRIHRFIAESAATHSSFCTKGNVLIPVQQTLWSTILRLAASALATVPQNLRTSRQQANQACFGRKVSSR